MDESLLQQPHPHMGRPRVGPRTMRPTDPENHVIIPCPASVSEAVWAKAQARLADNKTHLSGNRDRVFMLPGRAVCPEYGEPMTIVGDGRLQVGQRN